MIRQAVSNTPGDMVIRTAIQMEDVGRDFYEAFALGVIDAKMRDICTRLALEEADHRKVFERLRSELAREGRTVLLSDGFVAEARQAAKRAATPDKDTVCRMACCGDVRTLLDLAVRMEEESVRFYRGLAETVGDQAALDRVIHEELEHLRVLQASRDEE
jgi:rubrerythrin